MSQASGLKVRVPDLALASHCFPGQKASYVTLSLSTQVYHWVLAKYCCGDGVNPVMNEPPVQGGVEKLQLVLAIAMIIEISSCHLGQWLMCDFSFHLFLKEQCHKDMKIFSKICAAIHQFIHTLFSRLVTIKRRTLKG